DRSTRKRPSEAGSGPLTAWLSVATANGDRASGALGPGQGRVHGLHSFHLLHDVGREGRHLGALHVDVEGHAFACGGKPAVRMMELQKRVQALFVMVEKLP